MLHIRSTVKMDDIEAVLTSRRASPQRQCDGCQPLGAATSRRRGGWPAGGSGLYLLSSQAAHDPAGRRYPVCGVSALPRSRVGRRGWNYTASFIALGILRYSGPCGPENDGRAAGRRVAWNSGSGRAATHLRRAEPSRSGDVALGRHRGPGEYAGHFAPADRLPRHKNRRRGRHGRTRYAGRIGLSAAARRRR